MLHNLPQQLTSFIGREREIAEIKRLLSTTRLLTLTGTGGCGKTRLSLRVASDLLDDFEYGVFVVALAPIHDPTLVVPTIAQTLGIKESGGQPLLESIKEHIGDKSTLLVLDNFEQVTPAAQYIGRLLSECPGLKIMVTSRAVLHLYGEQEFPVPPLALPEKVRGTSVESLSNYEAVELFSQRAKSIRPGFSLTSANASAVAEICYKLDGLPLAIELAAARSNVLPPQAMLARLDSRLQLLTGGPRNMPPRQQTMRGAIGWSYDLLNSEEKALFRSLSVFVRGCTLDAVEAVGGEEQPGLDLLDSLASLVDKSLLRQEEQPDGEPRFAMLETIREYALDQLRASGEQDAVRRKHAEYFLNFSEAAEPKLRGPQQAIWLNRMEKEHDNMRAALAWLMEQGEAEKAARLGAALWWFWYSRGYLAEGRKWLDAILDFGGPQTVETALRARVLNGAGSLAIYQGDYPRARTLFEESLALQRALDDKPSLARTYNNLGVLASGQGNYAQATTLFEESLALRREIGDQWGTANSLHNIAYQALYQGDYDRAQTLGEESLANCRELEDRHGITNSLFLLALLSLHRSDFERAITLHNESLALYRDLGDKRGIASSLFYLGVEARYQGNFSRAAQFIEESLGIYEELGEKLGIVECLEGFAALMGAQGQGEQAARLYGAAEALRSNIGAPMPPANRSEYERNVEIARSGMDTELFKTAWARGTSMTLDDALAYASEMIPQPEWADEAAAEDRDVAVHVPTTPYPSDLSKREVQVLRLVASGLTDIEVAEKLSLSPRTIHAHLHSIYGKIDVNTRHAATLFAIENNLL